MIDLVARPLAIVMEPCKPMGHIDTFVNLDVDVADMVKIAGGLSNANFWARRSPSKNPGLGIVMQNLSNASTVIRRLLAMLASYAGHLVRGLPVSSAQAGPALFGTEHEHNKSNSG